MQTVYSFVVGLHWFATILPGAVIVLLARSRGLTLAEVGAYASVYALVAAALELPTGGVADAVGRKRATLAAYGLAALAKLALLFAASLPAFVAYAVLSGAARALGSGALEAWFVNALQEIDPQVDLQPRLARANNAELLALALGSLGGAALPALLGPALPAGASPLAAPVLASLAFHLLALLAAGRLVREEMPAGATGWGALLNGMRGLPSALRDAGATIRHDALLPTLLALEFVIGFVLAATETYWQPFFAERFGLGGSSTLVLGGLLAGCFGAGLLGNLCASRAVALAGGRPARLGGLTQLVGGAALLALAWQPVAWVAALLLWLTYFARTVFSSSFSSLYNARVPDGRRSLMLSVLSVALFAGVSLGNAALGVVAGRASVSWAWTLAAAVVLLSLGLFVRLERALKPASTA